MNKVFSKRIVLTYTCIVAIPLVLIVVIASQYLLSKRYAEVAENCMDTATEQMEEVIDKCVQFTLLESLVNGNNELILFFAAPETHDESEIIKTMRNEASAIERLLFVMPSIYGIRIITCNPAIPERWPVFLNASRLYIENSEFGEKIENKDNYINNDIEDLKLGRWEFNYSASYMGNLDMLKNLSVCTNRPLVKNKKTLGYLQISMKMEEFFPFLYSKSTNGAHDFLFKLDGENNLNPVSNNEIDDMQGKLSDLELKLLNESIQKMKSKNPKNQGLQNKSYAALRLPSGKGHETAIWYYLSDLDLYLVHTCSNESLIANLRLFLGCTFAVLIVSLALFFLLIRFITSRLMSRVYTVMDGMGQVRSGNLNAYVKVDGNDEVTETQSAFNEMTKKLREQIEQIKAEQSLVADTEIKAMQNQINAHFLYNALETIKMQAVLANQDDIAESLTVLGKMMRYCLRWRQHRVQIKLEIEYIRSYIYILNLRNDYVISLETEIPDSFANLEIPKMVLQPLVENAFQYAIEPTGVSSIIKVFTRTDLIEKKLYLCVQDFGCGIDSGKLKDIRSYLADSSYEREGKGNIGLKNIQQRLELFYGIDYRIQIESAAGKGTLVSVPVPLSASPI